MDGLPDERGYYIGSTESSHSGEPLWANLDDKGVTSAGPEKKTVWSMHYLDRKKGICYFGHPESGGYGGIHHEERDARRMEEPQHWIIKKGDDGYIVTREFDGEELFAHVDKDGKVSASATHHSWVFEPANEK
ncbi:hypothetical protein K503DRAFT_869316 [Rhizopogon vinicolor AM-OR11-026]|uniref:Ricin B lectin domain-containing protein n=1 Tax=Rhizopogon vinicolor AM-OR11-026 TaxID=1314800 RepID=A0A1B7MMJ0_9AGAM|nr:hypothetical protein K503DRAFT_869316 [Rhizopogon vinicolor AM-OR11-026]